MTVLEFCNARNIQTQTVLKYIQRNPSIFEGHTSKNGQNMEIDNAAFDILDEKYPVPPEIIPAPNVELVAELDRAKSYIIQLQQQVIEQNQVLALAEKNKFLLEEAKEDCDNLQRRNDFLTEEIGNLKAQLSISGEKVAKATEEAIKASEEVERLRNRNFWQRLFNT